MIKEILAQPVLLVLSEQPGRKAPRATRDLPVPRAYKGLPAKPALRGQLGLLVRLVLRALKGPLERQEQPGRKAQLVLKAPKATSTPAPRQRAWLCRTAPRL